MLATTPQPPYWAVIFTSIRSENTEGYAEMGDRMAELAAQQPGYLGMESVEENGVGMTVSYWESPEAIRNWRVNAEHLVAQKFGREQWYSAFKTRVAQVVRDNSFGE